MKINEAVKRTGLTKKAIRYYEEKDLISPKLNGTNGYKDYSHEIVEDLQMIAFLRIIDMPVTQIKEFLDSTDKRNDLLNLHLYDLDNKINELEIAKEAIKKVLNNKTIDYNQLNTTIISHQLQYKDFILKRLTTLFPDAYGKYLLLHFGPFLNESLDNEEKKKSFDEIIEFFDDVDTIEFPKEWRDCLAQMDEEELIKTFADMNNKLIKLSNTNIQDQEEVNKLKTEIESHLKHQKNMGEQEIYKQMRQLTNQIKDSFKKSGYYDKFVENLKVISHSYKEYTEKLENVNEALGLRYDEDNNIIMR